MLRKTFIVFSVIFLACASFALAQELGDPIPEFPAEITTVLGIGASILVGFVKKVLPDNDLVRLVVAGVISALTAFVAILAAGVPLSADAAFIVAATFGFSQVTWTSFKAIAGLGK